MSCKFRQPKVTYFDCNVKKKKILVLKKRSICARIQSTLINAKLKG